MSFEVAKWVCRHPSEVMAKQVSALLPALTHADEGGLDDGGWGVDTDVLLGHFRNPVSVPALARFVKPQCPYVSADAPACEGGLSLSVRNSLLKGWDASLARESSEALRSGPECPLRLLQALTRWYQPKAEVRQPVVN